MQQQPLCLDVRIQLMTGLRVQQTMPLSLHRFGIKDHLKHYVLLRPDIISTADPAFNPELLYPEHALICAGAAAEDAREKAELQRAYYGLLHALAHAELAGTLLGAPPATRDAALQALVSGAASHVDAVVRKTCCQVRLVLLLPQDSDVSATRAPALVS